MISTRRCVVPSLAALILAVVGFGPPAPQGKVHRVEIRGDRARGRFRFEPADLEARPGDVVRFVAVSGAPHSVVFDSAGLGRHERELLDGAMPDRMSLLSGPLLTEDGQVYEITIPRLAPGSYRFYCLPHRAYRAEGTLRVVE